MTAPDRLGKKRSVIRMDIVDMNSLDLPGRPQDNRVVVAMSGGVDSSVVAAILKRDGHDVVGITLQLYDHGAATHRAGSCCAGRDIDDARRVADAIGIPHYVLNYEERFRKAVIDPFAASYVAGETPIPCVSCNQTVKFSDLLETARDLGASALATGHYIRSRANGAHRALHRPEDAERDQSYFLFATTQDQIDYLRFPLGDLSKREVRAIAAEIGLAVADKQDSQDICFVPQGRYSDIVARLQPGATMAGDIVHIDGRLLGRHDGILRYTVGQRRGIGIAAAEPLYVVQIDAPRARIVVGPREALETRRVFLRDVNWLGDGDLSSIPADGLDVFAKVRSTRKPGPATLFSRDDATWVELAQGEAGVAPGQACVLYDGDAPAARVLGGGFIARSQRGAEAEAMLGRLTSPAVVAAE